MARDPADPLATFLPRAALLLAVLLSVAAGLLSRAPEPRAQAPGAAQRTRPNVLLVSIDSLRRDHVHAYGYARETTPAIDRLAREGALFGQAVSPSSWTLPAHMTLLTSMPPRQHGLVKVQRKLTRELTTLPRVFQANGYVTAGIVSGPLLSSKFGFAQGFDFYDDFSVPQTQEGKADRGATSPLVVRLATDWLATWHDAADRKPFFLFLHLWDVHYDYAPPPPYDTMFDPDYAGTMTAEGFNGNPAIRAGMNARDLAHLVALYDGEIRYTDEHLGMVIDALAGLGVLDDTIVTVTADHGDEFFEHGRKGHGLTVYDELILVPLVFRYPRRIDARQVVGGQVRLADIGPTLLGLAGLTPPPGFGSGGRFGSGHREQDLSPWITGSAAAGAFPDLTAVAESQMIYLHGTGAVRTEEKKLVDYNVAERPRELYDLRSDPGEQVDRARADPAEVERLTQLREAWGRALATWKSPAGLREIDTDSRARLRALGYIE